MKRTHLCLWRKATEAHHITPRGRAPGHPNLHRAENGAGLCWACHRSVHDLPDPEWIKPLNHLNLI